MIPPVMTDEMKWASAISSAGDLERAAQEVTEELRFRLGGRSPDVAIAFVSEHHRESFADLPKRLREPLGSPALVGCSASAVIGDGREVEGRPGLSVTAATLPGVDVAARHHTMVDLPQPAPGDDTADGAGTAADRDAAGMVLLADPYTFDTERVLDRLDALLPDTVKVGGLASGSQGPGETWMWIDDDSVREGAVAVNFTGDVAIDTAVAQGCRPIGEPMFVTKCRRHLLLEVDDKPVLDVLKKLFESLDDTDRLLFRESLFIGVSTVAKSLDRSPREFLVRNVLGMRSTDKALAVGVRLEPTQIVQFHVRDKAAAASDLERTLERTAERAGATPSGALLFTCLGRGMRLFGTPDHDTDVFRRLIGNVPLGGFFCNGEIGPVGRSTYLHGYTSAFSLFRRSGR